MNSAVTRLIEEQLFEQVLVELKNGQKRDGLWAKALANGDGLEEKAKSLYIHYRVQSIKDEMEISGILAEEAERQLEKSSAIEYQNQINLAESLKKTAIKTLSDRGYRAKLKSAGWKVTHPQGGWLEFSSTDELINFAKSIELYKKIK